MVPSDSSSGQQAVAEAARIKNCLSTFAQEFDREFDKYLTAQNQVPGALFEAVRYSALSPGKRLRPYLTVRSCELLGGSRQQAWPAAAAIECIHAFSLVHDDLPAMDDDDLRRGRPTTHKKFGEAMAILAGDTLSVLPFEIIATHVSDAHAGINMIRELALATGWAGMIGGQAADIIGEHQPPSLELTTYIHTYKTAALFRAACRIGALAAGSIDKQSNERCQEIGSFGEELGKAFQITDDLLDVVATSATMGKETGKDSAAGKQTYPRCVGIEESRRLAKQAVERAIGHLGCFGIDADDLREIARFVVDRTY